jgi:hypothetical protein
MSHMPYWLAKTPEMIAMDQWFSLADAGDETALAARYAAAITRVTQANSNSNSSVFKGSAASLGPIGAGATDSFDHFGKDWLNLTNLSSGGDFWPQIPSWQIIIWLRQGVLTAAKKALGVNPPGLSALNASEIANVFHAEIDADPSDPRDTVLPLVTIWVCTGNHSSAGFEVDAVRGPTVVELVIATPPPRLQSRLWSDAKTQIDQFWNGVHADLGPPDPPSDEFPQS